MSYPHHTSPTTYFAAGALADLEVMKELLGVLPQGHRMELPDVTLGLVTGAEINAHLRTDMFPDGYETRVLAHKPGETVEGVLFNVSPEQLEAIHMYTSDGVVTRAVNVQLGENEPVGHAVAHFVKPALIWKELERSERGIFPNGKEATLQSARETHRRWQETLHRHPGERR